MDGRPQVKPFLQHPSNRVSDKGFAGRLAFMRWLWFRSTQRFRSNKDFAAFIGVSYDLYNKWADSAEPPTVRATGKAFVEGGLKTLGATEGWLLDGVGNAPEPELWKLWTMTKPLPGAPAPGAGGAGRKRKEG
jgi:hypothetical protein